MNKPKHCAVIIFEGRCGSGELTTRLQSHPDLLFYPEVLAPVSQFKKKFKTRWRGIRARLDDLRNGVPIPTKGKAMGPPRRSQVVTAGLKTRINTLDDADFFLRSGKPGNFYVIEHEPLRRYLEKNDFKVIRLNRSNILKHAVSWIRAVELHNERRVWNIRKTTGDLAPSHIDLDALHSTLEWLKSARDKHERFFEIFDGPKLNVNYEDMCADWRTVEKNLLDFLSVPNCPLTGLYKKVTPDDLSKAISNYENLCKFAAQNGLASCL